MLRFATIFIFAAALFSAKGFAQQIPLVVGGVAETGYGVLEDGSDGAGLSRMTPFVGVWIQGWGYLRIGYGLNHYKRTPDDTMKEDKVSVNARDFTTQLGISLGGVGKPYIVGSFTRAKHLSDLGDVAWNEWGAGLGATFQLNAYAAIVTEMEYRWVRGHYDPVERIDVSGTRLQMNLGFVVYVY